MRTLTSVYDPITATYIEVEVEALGRLLDGEYSYTCGEDKQNIYIIDRDLRVLAIYNRFHNDVFLSTYTKYGLSYYVRVTRFTIYKHDLRTQKVIDKVPHSSQGPNYLVENRYLRLGDVHFDIVTWEYLSGVGIYDVVVPVGDEFSVCKNWGESKLYVYDRTTGNTHYIEPFFGYPNYNCCFVRKIGSKEVGVIVDHYTSTSPTGAFSSHLYVLIPGRPITTVVCEDVSSTTINTILTKIITNVEVDIDI